MVDLVKSLNLMLLKPPLLLLRLQPLPVGHGHSAPGTDGEERALRVSRQSKAAEEPGEWRMEAHWGLGGWGPSSDGLCNREGSVSTSQSSASP